MIGQSPSRRTGRASALIVVALAWAVAGGVPSSALAQSSGDKPPKWGAHLDLEGKPGTKRNLGEADLFVPLAQNDRTLLFANARGRFDDSDSIEGNFGLGLRRMVPEGWNLGGYAYFDRLRSEHHNVFHQTTIGLEALGRDWDIRANGYVPVGERIKQVDSLSTAELSGTTVVFRGGEERGLAGFDAEVGWRVPFWKADALQALRIYAGGFRFGDGEVRTVAGPRGRLELTFDQVPGLWEGSRLALGTEVQHDDVRGTQAFFTVQLRIPLEPGKEQPERLTAQERRMTAPVVRDVDIVSQAGAFGAPETVTQTASGATFSVLNSSSTAGTDLDTAVTAAGNNSTVILSGTFQTANNVVSLATGQNLISGSIDVRSAAGRVATLNTSAAIVATNATRTVIINAGGALSGLTISNAFSGGGGGQAVLVADGSTGVTIANNTITTTQSGANGAVALSFGNNTSGTVSGNTLTVTGSGAATTMTALGVGAGNTTVTVTGNSLSAAGGTTNNMAAVAGAAINAGSTGNVRGSGACSGAPASGSISFTNGTTCP